MSDADDRIVRALAQLGAEHEPPAGWERRVLAAIEEPPRRRRWWLAIPLAALAFAAVLIVPHVARKPAGLALVVARGPSATRLRGAGADTGRLIVARGEPIHAAVRGGERQRAIWLYRDGIELVARCPGTSSGGSPSGSRESPACRSSGDELTLDLTPRTIGTYQVIAWSSQAELPVPNGVYDADVAAATAAHASSKRQVVEVQ